MIYKPNSCSPFIDVSDIKDVPFFLKCQIDSSNSRVDGYSIRILDSENNQVFPQTDDSATRRAVDIDKISLTDDLFKITKEKTGSFKNVDTGSYKNLNTGLNGSVLMIPFIVSELDDPTTTIQKNQLTLNNINANFPTLFNGGDYKWIITLYQLQYKNGQWIIPTDTKYYDIILTTGVVLGSCPKRIHSFHNKNLQKDYWMELLHLYSFNADNGYENWSYNSNYPITSDNIVGHRVRINNFDQSFGYIYPVEGEDGILKEWLNHPDNTDAQNAAAANAFRVYELGDGNGDADNLPATRKADYLYEKDYFGKKYHPEAVNDIEWNDQVSNPSNSYFSITYKTQYNPNRDGFYPLGIDQDPVQFKIYNDTKPAYIKYKGHKWIVVNGGAGTDIASFNKEFHNPNIVDFGNLDWYYVQDTGTESSIIRLKANASGLKHLYISRLGDEWLQGENDEYADKGIHTIEGQDVDEDYYFYINPSYQEYPCVSGKTRVAFDNNTCPDLSGDKDYFRKDGILYTGLANNIKHKLFECDTNTQFWKIQNILSYNNYAELQNGWVTSKVSIDPGYYRFDLCEKSGDSDYQLHGPLIQSYYYCFYAPSSISIHKSDYEYDAALRDKVTKYTTLSGSIATAFNGIFIPTIDNTTEISADEDGLYTVKVRWMRAPDADTIGEIKNKTFYAINKKRNYTFITWDKDADRINKTPSSQGYEDCKLNQPRGLIGVIDEKPVAFVDSESGDAYKSYISPIFYNIPCETNKDGIMFLRPFNGLEPGMLWQELDPTKTKDQLRHYLIDTLNTEYWYTKYRPMYLGSDNSNPKYSSTVIPDITKYQIKSHFKTSDENPFSFRDEPTIDIKVYPLEGSNSGTAYTEIDGVIEIDGSRNIHCEGEDYNQAQNINWKSFQWILYDENGNVIDVTDPQYSGKIEYDFYGLVGGKEYTLELIIETYEGYIIKSTKTLKATFKEETGLKYPLKIELDCDLHATKIYLNMDGGVVASSNHSASAVERDGYLDLRDSITYDSMVYPDTSFSASLSTKPETDSILVESEHIIKSDNYNGRIISVEGKTESGNSVMFEVALSNIETTGDEEVRIGDGFRLIYNYKGGNG